MANIVIPSIGTSGSYTFKSPLDVLTTGPERFTCKAVRNLSDYIANREDPEKNIYIANGLTSNDFDTDILVDMPIVSLQSDIGHWVYIPARFILTYPITNGIPYRSVMIGASLPSIPADRDVSFLLTDIANIIKDSLGVDSIMKVVETSRVILVPKETHDLETANRKMKANYRPTDRVKYMELLTQHNTALEKITALEDYIKSKLT